MNVEVSPETKQRLDQRLATGRYASPDELLRVALDALARQEQGDDHARFVADLKESLEDERAGRAGGGRHIESSSQFGPMPSLSTPYVTSLRTT